MTLLFRSRVDRLAALGRLPPGLPLLLAGLLQVLMLYDVLHGTLWPPPEALLIGDRLVGTLARQVDPTLPIGSPWGYDSQYTWALAVDPTLRDPAVAAALDAPAYRSQRVLFPLAAWMLPGGGGTLPARLWLLGLAGWLLGAWAAWRLARRLGAAPLPATLLFAANAGVVFSLVHPLADLWAAALAVLGTALWIGKRPRWAALIFGLAGLAKETTVLVPISIGWLNLRRGRIWSPENGLLGLSLLPIAAWQLYLHARFGIWPVDQSINNIDAPYFGLVNAALSLWVQDRSLFDVAVAAGVAALALYALIRIGWPKTVAQAVLWGQCALLTLAGQAIVEGIGSDSRASILFFVFFGLWAARPTGPPTSDDSVADQSRESSPLAAAHPPSPEFRPPT